MNPLLLLLQLLVVLLLVVLALLLLLAAATPWRVAGRCSSAITLSVGRAEPASLEPLHGLWS